MRTVQPERPERPERPVAGVSVATSTSRTGTTIAHTACHPSGITLGSFEPSKSYDTASGPTYDQR